MSSLSDCWWTTKSSVVGGATTLDTWLEVRTRKLVIGVSEVWVEQRQCSNNGDKLAV